MRTKGAFHQTIAGLNNALKSKLYVMTNTTMLRTNVDTIPATLDFLADNGVPTIELNALIYSGHALTVGTGLRESELQPILDIAVPQKPPSMDKGSSGTRPHDIVNLIPQHKPRRQRLYRRVIQYVR